MLRLFLFILIASSLGLKLKGLDNDPMSLCFSYDKIFIELFYTLLHPLLMTKFQ